MISTHILDTHLGKPAAQVKIRLLAGDNRQVLGEGYTDQDGRLKDFGLDQIEKGSYVLEFEIAPYFAKQQLTTFFPLVSIQFYIERPEEHYHVPLLISPFAYSTYRGS